MCICVYIYYQITVIFRWTFKPYYYYDGQVYCHNDWQLIKMNTQLNLETSFQRVTQKTTVPYHVFHFLYVVTVTCIFV